MIHKYGGHQYLLNLIDTPVCSLVGKLENMGY